MATAQPRVNIYLSDPALRERIKVAAARAGVSVSDYCQEAIRRRLTDEGFLPPDREARREAARDMDRMRRQVGPIGIPVEELVAEGRR